LNPHLVGGSGTFQACDVAVANHYAYLTCEAEGVKIFDVRDPRNPVLISTFDTPGHAMGITISDNYAIVGDKEAGVQVVDVSDPVHPVSSGSFDTPGGAEWTEGSRGVAVVGGFVYLADGVNGLYVFRLFQ
jgi:hypothetical protein